MMESEKDYARFGIEPARVDPGVTRARLVHDVVPSAVEALTGDGVSVAASSKEVAGASDVVITMLPDSPARLLAALSRVWARLYGNMVTTMTMASS